MEHERNLILDYISKNNSMVQKMYHQDEVDDREVKLIIINIAIINKNCNEGFQIINWRGLQKIEKLIKI